MQKSILLRHLGTPHRRGQTLIIVALMFVMLLGFVGLVVDVGRIFIELAQLRRAVDSASLSAAAQFREGRGISEMTAIARELMEVNGVTPTTITVDNCQTDATLCPTTPPRKFVRITAGSVVRMTFLSLLGINQIPISSTAVGEAASLDVVLVIDISESMTWDAARNDPMRDPDACNNADSGGTDGYPGDCHPFQEVKAAADNFIQRVLDKPAGEEEDRLAIVTFANGWSSDINQGTFYRPGGNSPTWINDRGTARSIVRSLRVFDPPDCSHVAQGPCRNYNPDGTYAGFDCLSCRDPNLVSAVGHEDWSYYTTTNIGGGLLRAGNMFPYQKRDDSLWVVILLTDGMANATFRTASDNISQYDTYPVGYCPESTENDPLPLCQDKNVDTRHVITNLAEYDADDYARDMTDFVGCMGNNPAPGCHGHTGQGALIFSIGLGNGVLDTGCPALHPGDPNPSCEVGSDSNPATTGDARPYGAYLLRYISAVGDDGDPNTDQCTGIALTNWCGNYYFAPTGNQLDRVFEDIASRIFTRIHQ
jgi:hypothetical protein